MKRFFELQILVSAFIVTGLLAHSAKAVPTPFANAEDVSALILGDLSAKEGNALGTAQYFEHLTRRYPQEGFLVQCFHGALQAEQQNIAQKCFDRLSLLWRSPPHAGNSPKATPTSPMQVLPSADQDDSIVPSAEKTLENIFSNQSARHEIDQRQLQLTIFKARMIALTYPEKTAPKLFVHTINALDENQQKALIAETARFLMELKRFQRGTYLFAEIAQSYPEISFQVFYAEFLRHTWQDSAALAVAEKAFRRQATPLTLLEYVETLQQNGRIDEALALLSSYQNKPSFVNPVLRTRMEKIRNLRPEPEFRALLESVDNSEIFDQLDAGTITLYLSNWFDLKDYQRVLAIGERFEKTILSSNNSDAMMMMFYLRGASLLETGDANGALFIDRVIAIARFARFERQRTFRKSIAEQGIEQIINQLQAERQIIRSPGDYLITARVLTENHRESAALALLQNALEYHPNEPTLLYEAAMVAIKAEQLSLLEKYLLKAIDINPKDYHAHNALGYSWVDKGVKLTLAKQHILRALAQQPLEPVILDSLGWYYFRAGETDKALTFLKRAYYLQHDSEIAAHVIEALLAQNPSNNRREVKSFYEHALQLSQARSDIETRKKEEALLRSTAKRIGLSVD